MTRYDDDRLKSGHGGSDGIEFNARDVLLGNVDDTTVEQVVSVDE